MALSDPQGMLASPLTIIHRQDEAADIAAVSRIIEQNQVERVIVGLPISMNGSIGRQAEKVKAFTRQLCEQIHVPVEFRDERLTTVAAQRLMQITGSKKSRKKDRHDDAVAAAFILQGYLDEKRVP